MINILVSLRVWEQLWTDRHIIIFCNNRAVVDIMDRHKTRDRHLGEILRDILFLMAKLMVWLNPL